LLFFNPDIQNFSAAQISWVLGLILFLSGVARKFHHFTFITLFSWLGRNTLIILLLHAFFLLTCKFAGTLFIKVDQTGIAYSLFTVLVVLAGCLLSAKIMDRLQISSIIFGTNIYIPYAPAEKRLTRS
jgi:fucose 4-O-acetylase-like acetyltransferase